MGQAPRAISVRAWIRLPTTAEGGICNLTFLC